MKVKEIMTEDPACCTPDATLEQVALMMVEHDCGQIPVVDDERARRLIGVITDRDIVCRAVAQGMNPTQMRARDVMSAPAITVGPDMRVEDCCKVLEDKQVRRAPVADEQGQCHGIVSLADIAQTAPEKLTGEVVRTVSQRTAWASGREKRRAI
jgi:CBS domain-containing protein